MMTEIQPPYVDVDIEDLEGFLDKITLPMLSVTYSDFYVR